MTQPLLASAVVAANGDIQMAQPPKATPNSDIDGIHQDEVRNTDIAADRGESAGTVAAAKDKTVARPVPQDKPKNRDDRTG